MDIVTVGLDPALRRGSLVITIWSMSEGRLTLKSWRKLYTWDHPVAHTLKLELLREQAFRIAFEVEKAFHALDYPDGPYYYVPWLALDWDIKLASFGGRRFISSMLSYFIGQIDANLGRRGLASTHITPSEVRRHHGLKPGTKKRMVHKHLTFLPRTDGDTKDAIILAGIQAERFAKEHLLGQRD